MVSVGEDVEKLGPFYTVGGIVNGTAAMENRRTFPEDIKPEMLEDPAIPLLAMCLRALEAGSQKRDLPTCVHGSPLHKGQEVEATSVTDE